MTWKYCIYITVKQFWSLMELNPRPQSTCIFYVHLDVLDVVHIVLVGIISLNITRFHLLIVIIGINIIFHGGV